MARTKTAPKLVRYVSPFGSPAWMTRDEAERYLAEDDALWLEMADVKRETGHEMRSAHMIAIGPPRIEVHE